MQPAKGLHINFITMPLNAERFRCPANVYCIFDCSLAWDISRVQSTIYTWTAIHPSALRKRMCASFSETTEMVTKARQNGLPFDQLKHRTPSAVFGSGEL